MADLSPRHLEILQHSLGVDEYGRTPKGFVPYTRNHFCAGAADEPDCRALVEMGFMEQFQSTDVFPYFNCKVTPNGILAMKEASPAPPKLTAGQKRWQEYLRYSDANDCTFKEWLGFRKSDWYLEMKVGQW